MSSPHPLDARRRHFIAGAAATGAAALLGLHTRPASADPPPETRKLRLLHVPAICHAPQYLAEELLHLEGITAVEYVTRGTRYIPDALAESKADMSMWNATEFIPHMDAGRPVVVLAGIHGGCFEVFGNDRVHSIRDLRGKTVAIMYFGGGDHILLASMLAYVGIDPTKEVNWLPGTTSLLDAMDAFTGGKADAFVGFAQQPVEMRAKRVGHVIVNTTTDRPWSQYFCCMLGANREFVQRHPVTTKRALRAILKAADICNTEPLKVARFLADKLYEPRFPVALEVVKGLPYSRWREANPEDTIRFHALRLHEVGMVKNIPNRLIAQGMDLRFLNELKRELKG
jgi:NitT/TauT family transport system substrate-binding protein